MYLSRTELHRRSAFLKYRFALPLPGHNGTKSREQLNAPAHLSPSCRCFLHIHRQSGCSHATVISTSSSGSHSPKFPGVTWLMWSSLRRRTAVIILSAGIARLSSLPSRGCHLHTAVGFVGVERLSSLSSSPLLHDYLCLRCHHCHCHHHCTAAIFTSLSGPSTLRGCYGHRRGRRRCMAAVCASPWGCCPHTARRLHAIFVIATVAVVAAVSSIPRQQYC